MLGRNHVYCIAEISANHNGSIERAEAIIRAAAEAGADAVKLQTYTADTITLACDSSYFRIQGTLWNGYTLYDLYNEAHTPWEWTPRLMALANELGMDCFSSPFDKTAVDFLESCGAPCYKVASCEIIDIPLLKAIAATQKPVIVSTGMASLAEIDEAVRTLRDNGTTDVTLLKCTSAYPAPVEEANLRTIAHLADAFQCRTGLSDHTMGHAVAVAAVALGARVIEKHLTLARADGGPDSAFSMEPDEFKQMVNDIRVAEQALGSVCYGPTLKQQKSLVYRRSLFAVKDIRAGECFTDNNIRSIRPGHGLHTRYLPILLQKKAARDISKGTPLTWDLVQ